MEHKATENDSNIERQQIHQDKGHQPNPANESAKFAEEGSPLNSSQVISDSTGEYAEWANSHGLDTSHAQLHELLHFINPELNEKDIEDIRQITFTSVALAQLKGPKKRVGKKDIPVNVQNIEPETLMDVLNEGYKLEDLIPSTNDILTHVSPTTAEYIKQLAETLKTRRIDFLYGPTGVGKTTLIKTLAYHLNRPIYQETGSETKTYVELTRSVQFRKTKSGRETVMVPSGLVKAAITGAIYQIDEFNYLPGDVQLAIAQVVDEGEILLASGIRVPIHSNFGIVCTGNINYGGTNVVNDAVLRRAGGGHEVTYLPETEEIESVYEDFSGDIERINRVRGTKLTSTLVKEEVAKIVKTLRAIREAISEKYSEELKRLTTKGGGNIMQRANKSLPAMEDLVSYHEQFSFRRISEFVMMAYLLGLQDSRDRINFSEVFNQVFPSPTNGKSVVDPIVRRLTQGNQIVFSKNDIEEVEESETNEGLGEISVDDLLNMINSFRTMNLGNFIGDSDPSAKTQKTPAKGKPITKKIGVNQISLQLKSPAAVEIPDFEWTEEIDQTDIGDPLKKNDQINQYIHLINDEIQGIGKDEEGKNIYHEKIRIPQVLAMKNLVEFEYQGDRGFALLGWRGLIQDATNYNPKTRGFYIENKDRIDSYIQVYFPDQAGHILVNPQDGKIITISRFIKDFEISDQVANNHEALNKELESQGYLRVKAANDEKIHPSHLDIQNTEARKTEVERRIRIKNLVVEKMKGSMLHADNVPGSKDSENSDNTTISRQMFSAVENGSTMAKPLTPKTAGRYLKYKTLGINKILKSMELQHLNQKNILLTGPSGTGKSSLAKTYAIEHGMNYVAAQFHERVTEGEILKRIELKNGEIVEAALPLISAFKYGWVAELREINLATPSMIPFINTLLDRNGHFYLDGEKITRHPNFLPIATRNPFSAIYSGTKPMPSSFINRFTPFEVDYPSKHEEVDMLLDYTKNENPEFYSSTSQSELKQILGAMINIADITRVRLKDENLTIDVRQILQKQRISTDMLQDLLIKSNDKKNLLNRFRKKLKVTPHEAEVLTTNNIHYAIGLAELERFK